jgi:hypothetical protein
MNKGHFSVLSSFQKSLLALTDSKILVRILLPILITTVLAIFILVYNWNNGMFFLTELFKGLGWLSSVILKMEQWLELNIFTFIAAIVFLLLGFIFFYFTVLILTSVLLVPLIIPVVVKKYFPELSTLVKNKNTMPFYKSILNSLKYGFLYIFLLMISIPFFLIPGANILISFFLNSYLVKSIFPMDCLMDYATEDEYLDFLNKHNAYLWQLSFLNNSLLYIPVVNLIAPPVMALSFSIYCLGNIKK